MVTCIKHHFASDIEGGVPHFYYEGGKVTEVIGKSENDMDHT
jgi:hypothetical protein